MKKMMSGTMGLWLGRLAFLAAFGLIWQYAAANGIIDPLFIGKPSGILLFLWKGIFVDGSLVYEMLWTIMGTLVAFVVGAVGGILTGLLFVNYPFLERFFEPFLTALNALPRIALAPLFLLWFGLGLSSKVALGASLTYFIVLSSTTAGIRSVSADHMMLARTLGARSNQIFFRITLPNAVPTIFSGLKLGLIYALLGVIAGELIGAEHGLGQVLTYLSGTFQTNGVYAVLFVLGLIGVAVTALLEQIEKRLLKWR